MEGLWLLLLLSLGSQLFQEQQGEDNLVDWLTKHFLRTTSRREAKSSILASIVVAETIDLRTVSHFQQTRICGVINADLQYTGLHCAGSLSMTRELQRRGECPEAEDTDVETPKAKGVATEVVVVDVVFILNRALVVQEGVLTTGAAISVLAAILPPNVPTRR